MIPRQNSERRRTVLGALAIWVLASLLHAFVLTAQEGLSIAIALFNSALYYGLLALLAIPVWFFCAWQTRRRRAFAVIGPLHLLLLVVVVAAWLSSCSWVLGALGGGVAVEEQFEQGLWVLLQSVLTYTLMTSAMLTLQTSRRLEHQRRRQAELELLAREAEIRALRAQLRPHFLFNVLNSIYSLTHSEPEKAREMVALLADLMRATLEVSDQKLVSLRDEIGLIERYLEIEAVRLGERLEVTIDANTDAMKVRVPPFLLQPLVENAIKHGIAPNKAGGRIDVHARLADGGLELTVKDTGRGLASDIDKDQGRGLQITRARLENLYGLDYSMDLRDADPQGCEVILRLPLSLIDAPLMDPSS